jgi:hypothetical protein
MRKTAVTRFCDEKDRSDVRRVVAPIVRMPNMDWRLVERFGSPIMSLCHIRGKQFNIFTSSEQSVSKAKK